jgi:hypothetical protein
MFFFNAYNNCTCWTAGVALRSLAIDLVLPQNGYLGKFLWRRHAAFFLCLVFFSGYTWRGLIRTVAAAGQKSIYVRSFTRSQLFSATSPFLTTTKNSVRRGHSCTCSSTSPFDHHKELCTPGLQLYLLIHITLRPQWPLYTISQLYSSTSLFGHNELCRTGHSCTHTHLLRPQ